ncbi:MAG TPA: GNAT family N-acetyltransferase [Solirubrobacteraceae bacterium]|nr:GNAT family N-acetyltransferase [Solirubrobacteraceae bacterium]
MRLRALALADCETLLSWISSADALFQWSGPWDFRWPLDLLQLQRDLERAGDHRRRYVAVDTGNGLIGHAMLIIQPDHGLGVIGRVLIDPARRGEGLGTALMHEIVRVSFDELGLHRLQLNVYDFNLEAIACYERAGFVIEGRMRDSTRGSAGYWSGYLMALLEPEYRAHGDPEPGGVLVRRARFADAPALARLLTELGYPQEEEQAHAQLAAWAGDPRGTVFVAESDGSPAGLVAAYATRRMERPGSFARVVALAVDRARRRSGLGRRLLMAVEAWAAGMGCRDIEITSSRHRDDAHAFYRSLGFVDQCGRSARFRRPLGVTSTDRSAR